ncbi:MAG: baseplate J/gp47 family protein [Anaerolineae bacterium]
MAHIIELDLDEDVASIRERLEWVEDKQVLLVIPPGCKVLANTVNLKLLKRHAANLALQVVLVTGDRVTRELASELGFPLFSSLEKARGKLWERQVREEKLPKRVRRLESSGGQRQVVLLHGERPKLAQQIIAFFLVGILLLMLVAGGLFFLPGAQVTLRPTIELISETVQIQADPELEKIDYEGARIPARKVQVELEGTSQIPTATKKDAADARATGTVVFVNQLEQPVTIPLGTIVSTSAGTVIRFATVEEVTLDPKGPAEVNIIAIDPGPSGNVQRHLINTVEGPLALAVKVINDKPTGGGNVRQVGVVTQADKDRLKASLLQELQQRGYARLLENLKEQEFIPPESLEIIPLDEVYDKFVGDEADALSLKMHIVARGTAIGGYDANALVLRLLESRVKEGYRLIPEGLEFHPGEVLNVQDRKVTFMMRSSGFIAARIDPSHVISIIRGRPISLAEETLSQRLPLRQRPVIEVSPNWFGRVPWLPFRISINVEIGEI